MLILGIWMEVHSEGYWKNTAILCVFSIACAYSLALLAVHLKPQQRWLQIATTANILFLAAVISYMILDKVDNEGIFKIVAVLAILAALETLVVPVLGRLAKVQSVQPQATLLLTPREDGAYEDKRGRIYNVTEMSNHPTQPIVGKPGSD